MDSLTNILPQDLANIIIDYIDPNRRYLQVIQKNIETINLLKKDPVFMKIWNLEHNNKKLMKKINYDKLIKNQKSGILHISIEFYNVWHNYEKKKDNISKNFSLYNIEYINSI